MQPIDVCRACGARIDGRGHTCRPVSGPLPTYPAPPPPLPPARPAAPPAPFPLVPLVIAVATVAMMGVIAAPLAGRLLAHANDRPASVDSMPGGAAHLAGAAPAAVGADRVGPACLVGTWKETSNTETVKVPTIGDVRFAGAGAVVSFRDDGAGSEEYVGARYTAPVAGKKLVLTVTGVTTYRYTADEAIISYEALSAAGGINASLSGTPLGGDTLTREQKTGAKKYSCTGNSLTIIGANYQQELTRTGA